MDIARIIDGIAARARAATPADEPGKTPAEIAGEHAQQLRDIAALLALLGA